MSKKSFKKSCELNKVIAEVSKVFNQGKSNEVKLYNIYKLK